MRSLLAALLALTLLGSAPIDPECPHGTLLSAPDDGQDDGDPSSASDGPMTDAIDTSMLRPMCRREPSHPLCSPHFGYYEVSMAELTAIDAGLRSRFRYVDTAGSWRGSTACGACADYALTLGKALADRGQPGERMDLQLMFVPWKGKWWAHATLWVVTRDRGLAEVDVNDPPRALSWQEGSRACYVALDGRRRFVPLPGFGVDSKAEACSPM